MEKEKIQNMIINNKNLVAINSANIPGASRTMKIMQFVFDTDTFMNMSTQWIQRFLN